ncbi:MAG: NAD-dependent epimerase/dehydratase family protein [Rhizobacter sp.]|nr:NAD-dependent epimerase/dehydratase family protein [Ferruginibacter sp.]
MITVLGASGFVGSNLVASLRKQGIKHQAPVRGENLKEKELGHIIYCIGMTADFRVKPFETVEAHVSLLSDILQTCRFGSLTYLSSTRLYIKSKSPDRFLNEKDDIIVNATDPSDLFAASKLTGELLALNSGRENIKIVRLSNVFGADLLSENFITSVIRDAIKDKKVELFTTPDSAKDYISIKDACDALISIANLPGKEIYNLCYGVNTSNEAILNEIQKHTNAVISYSAQAKTIIFQEISNKKLSDAINFSVSENVIDSIPAIINAFRSS